MDNDNNLVQIRNLKKYFPIRAGLWKKHVGDVKAVDGISFHIAKGETLGLVGESGSGKTTTGRTILRALDPTDGEILFRIGDQYVDIGKLKQRELRDFRRHAQMIFQDPYSSLNPRMRVKEIIGEPLLVNGIARGAELDDRVEELMKAVGLRPEYKVRYPHAFSGGQRQRIGIARALALHPELVVCDEPVSALDVSIQAQTLNLLKDLQEQFNLTYLFIAHDLSVVSHISDRVAVMYVGRLVELADTNEFLGNPKHPYTEALLSAIPSIEPASGQRANPIPGEVPDPANPPGGCYFHPRCPYAQAICHAEYPPTVDVGRDGHEHYSACHFADQLTLAGID